MDTEYLDVKYCILGTRNFELRTCDERSTGVQSLLVAKPVLELPTCASNKNSTNLGRRQISSCMENYPKIAAGILPKIDEIFKNSRWFDSLTETKCKVWFGRLGIL